MLETKDLRCRSIGLCETSQQSLDPGRSGLYSSECIVEHVAVSALVPSHDFKSEWRSVAEVREW